VQTYVQAGLEALGDPTRFAILQSLARRPLAVSELAETLPARKESTK
jgi:DNA-binding transcriptional ArsR family regulator